MLLAILAIGHGWLDDLCRDMETEGYSCGAVVLGAHSVGAPHIRQRLYWVADAEIVGQQHGHCGMGVTTIKSHSTPREERCHGNATRPNVQPCGMADANSNRRGEARECVASSGHERPVGDGPACGMADSKLAGLEGYAWHGDGSNESGRIDTQTTGPAPARCGDGRADAPDGFWRAADGLFCRDEKWRPVEPGTFPLADGIPARVGRLRGYGNAIVPQVAAEFIRAYMDTKWIT